MGRIVSVPLSGLSFLIEHSRQIGRIYETRVSVPLSGLSFLIETKFFDDEECAEVSVPLSGLSFLIEMSRNLVMDIQKSFRPLIGVIISNFKSMITTFLAPLAIVSVPLSGLPFLIVLYVYIHTTFLR